MARLAPLVTAFFALLAMPARADFRVEQTATFSGEGRVPAQFHWAIADKEFRLDVTRGNETKSFVFNGRVFFVCGKVDKAGLEAVKRFDVKDKNLLASLEKGVCQDLSTDFGMRFFLSPYDAADNVDASVGFASSLALKNDQIELAGSVGTADKVKCVTFQRRYTIAEKESSAEQQVEETACNAPTINWRAGFAKQLGMTLIRQPNGKQYYQTLNADLKKMPGLTVTSTAKITGKSGDGRAMSRGYSLVTGRITEGALKPGDLGFPAGFETLDPETVATAAKSVAVKGEPSKTGPNLVDTLKMLILGVNPASALIGIGK